MTSPLARTVLIVDDEFLVGAGLQMQVEELGLEVCAVVDTADAAVAAALAHRPALVLMDMRLIGQRDGVDAALEIHQQVGSKIIFIIGSRDQTTLDRIALDHPEALLFKPISDRLLRGAIDRALA
jgi:CheY-like chemotaxis protein